MKTCSRRLSLASRHRVDARRRPAAAGGQLPPPARSLVVGVVGEGGAEGSCMGGVRVVAVSASRAVKAELGVHPGHGRIARSRADSDCLREGLPPRQARPRARPLNQRGGASHPKRQSGGAGPEGRRLRPFKGINSLALIYPWLLPTAAKGHHYHHGATGELELPATATQVKLPGPASRPLGPGPLVAPGRRRLVGRSPQQLRPGRGAAAAGTPALPRLQINLEFRICKFRI